MISNGFGVEPEPQQIFIPNKDNQHDGYTPQPVYPKTQQQVYPSYNGFQGNRPNPTPQKPIWDEDEDVVID